MTEVRWTYDDYHYKWDCECGAAHVFMFDGPRENEYKFCPACGGRIVLAEEGERDGSRMGES